MNRSRAAAVFSLTATFSDPFTARVFESCEELNHRGFWSKPTKRKRSRPNKALRNTRKRIVFAQRMRKRELRFAALTL